MRVYVTAQFKNWENKQEIDELCALVAGAWFEDFCFVRDIQEEFADANYMMKLAQKEIKRSDALLLDVTQKSTGRMLEAGMAYALGKKVILIAKAWTPIKDTLEGIADEIIYYELIQDIAMPLNVIYKKRI